MADEPGSLGIRHVARRTGLSQHLIRAWERRYSALVPGRSLTNRRLYSESDVEKLTLLRRAVDAGHPIGNVAHLSAPELVQLLSRPGATRREMPEPRQELLPGEVGTPVVGECLRAVQALDGAALRNSLTRSAAVLGFAALTEQVLLPLLTLVGERWRAGELTIAHEHLATAAVRTTLGQILDAFQPPAHAPRLIVTTPGGEMHELGSLAAAVTAAAAGWRALYLGPNMPAAEIARAVHHAEAHAVALGVGHIPDATQLFEELARLRDALSPDVPVLIGGRFAAENREVLRTGGFRAVADLAEFGRELDALHPT